MSGGSGIDNPSLVEVKKDPGQKPPDFDPEGKDKEPPNTTDQSSAPAGTDGQQQQSNARVGLSLAGTNPAEALAALIAVRRDSAGGNGANPFQANVPGLVIEGLTKTPPGAESALLSQAKVAAVAPKLTPETVKQYADELHEAIDKKDCNKIRNLLDNLTPADLKAIEDAYVNCNGNKKHRTLRYELEKKLDGDDWRKFEAMLNRDETGTNDAGNLMVSLSAINDNRGDAERRVLETFATLNSVQMQAMSEKFQRDYGMSVDEALKKYDVSGDAMKAIAFMRQPSDQRQVQDIKEFAKFAVEKGNLDWFAVALRGDGPKYQQARAELSADKEFEKKVVDRFKPNKDGGVAGFVKRVADVALGPMDEIAGGIIKGDLSWGKVAGGLPIVEGFNDLVKAVGAQEENIELLSALDILHEGRVSLATIAINNTGSLFGWFDNKDNIKLAAQNATENERKAFKMGKDIVDSGRQPNGQQEQNAVDFYNRVHKAFKNCGEGKETAQWEDKLLTGGSVISAMAEADSTSDRFTALENLSMADWNRLKDSIGGEQFRKQIEQYVNMFAKPQETELLMQLLDRKLLAKTHEDSQKIRRSLFVTIQQNKENGWFSGDNDYDGKKILPAIANLSEEEAARYKNEADFRRDVDQFISKSLEGWEKTYALRMLAQVVETGRPPKEGPVERVIFDVVNDVDSKVALRDIEAALKEENFRKLMAGDPTKLSEADRNVRLAIEQVILQAATDSGAMYRNGAYNNHRAEDAYRGGPNAYDPVQEVIDKYTKPLFETGRLPVDLKAELNLKTREFFEEAANVKPEELKRLIDQHHLSDQERQLIAEIQKNGGKMTLADAIRAMVIGDGDTYADFKGPLSRLTNAQKQELREQYRKYGNLDEEFMRKVDAKDRNIYRTLLTSNNVDGRQDFYDNLERALRSESGIAPDGTLTTLERSLTDQAALLTDFQSRFEQLPPDKQALANKYFAEALEDYQTSKKAFAEKLYNVAVLVGGLAVGIATGGVALPAMLAVACVAAAGRVAMLRAIEGEDYDMSLGNVLKDLAVGAVTGGLSVIGPETIAGMRGIGMVASARFVDIGGDVVAQGLRQGGKQIVAKEMDALLIHSLVRGEAISEEALLNVAKKAVAEGVDPRTLLPALRQATEQSGREVVEGAIRSSLAGNMREAGMWATIGGGSNVAIESTVGIAEGNLDISRLPGAFLTGAITGGGMAISFKVAGAAVKPIVAHFRAAPDGTLSVHAEPGEVLTLEAHLVDGSKTTIHVGENGAKLPEGVQSVGIPGQKIEDIAVVAEDITKPNPAYPRGGNFEEGSLTPDPIEKPKPVPDAAPKIEDPPPITKAEDDTSLPAVPKAEDDTPLPAAPRTDTDGSGGKVDIDEPPPQPVPANDGKPIVRTNDKGLIAEVVRPDGQSMKYGYDRKGIPLISRRDVLTDIEFPDGFKVHLDNRGRWVTESGHPMPWEDVRLLEDGSLAYKTQEGDNIFRPDGTKEIVYDKVTAYYDLGASLPREIVNAEDGSKFVSQFNDKHYYGVKLMVPDGNGGFAVDAANSYTWNGKGFARESDGRLVGYYLSQSSDGVIRVQGPVRDEYGRLISDVGRQLDGRTIDSVQILPEGGRMLETGSHGAALIENAYGQITGWKGAEGGSTAVFQFGEKGELTSVFFEKQTLVKGTDGMWYSEAGELIAKDVKLSSSSDRLTVTPAGSGEASPLFANKFIESMNFYPDKPPWGNYKYRPPVDSTGLPLAVRPTSEEMLKARQLRELPPSEKGELRFETTRGTMTKRADGTWLEQDLNGTTRIFDAQGHLQSTVDGNGWTHTYRWKDGDLERVEMTVDGKTRAVERTSDGNWEFVNEDGTRKLATIDMGKGPEPVKHVGVDSDGSLTYLNAKYEGMRYGMDGVNAKIDRVGREYISGRPEVIKLQRERLESLRDKMFDNPERRKRFDDLLNQFEERMRKRAGDSGAADSEIANTYYQINKLLTADSATISMARRQGLAEQLLYNAVNPESIDQGIYNTCNVTAEVEKRMFARHPSEAVRLVTEVATTGRYITADGLIVDMRGIQGGLEPAGPAKIIDEATGLPKIKVDGNRHFADQIFQQTSVNSYWQGQTGWQFDNFSQGVRRATTIDGLRAGEQFRMGDVRYELVSPTGPRDSGERMMDYTTNPPSRVQKTKWTAVTDPISGETFNRMMPDGPADQPYLFNEQIAAINKIMTGQEEPAHFFVRTEGVPGPNGSMVFTNSADNFRMQLLDLQSKGGFPATIYVDTRQPLFSDVLTAVFSSRGAHVINAQEVFQNEAGQWMVRFTNQWGSKSNKTVPLEDLYRAMKSMPEGSEWRVRVSRLRERWFPSKKDHPHAATGDEFELPSGPSGRPSANGRGGGDGGGNPLRPGSDQPASLVSVKLDEFKRYIVEQNLRHISENPQAARGYKLQSQVLDYAQDQLKLLQQQGKIGPEWTLIPTETGSAADAVGADAILLNTKTREVRTLDVTSNDSKVDGTGTPRAQFNLEGTIYARNEFFDPVTNKLYLNAVDAADIRIQGVADPHLAIMKFDQDLKERLIALADPRRQLLTLDDIPPLLMIRGQADPSVIAKQVEGLKERFAQRARTAPDVESRHLLDELVRQTSRSTAYYNRAAKEIAPPRELKAYVDRQTQKVILDIAAARLRGTPFTNPPGGQTRVRLNRGDLKLNLNDDVTYNVTDAENLLRQNRDALRQNLHAELSTDSGKALMVRLRRQMPGKTDAQIETDLSNAIFAVEIRLGALENRANLVPGEAHPIEVLQRRLSDGRWQQAVDPKPEPAVVMLEAPIEQVKPEAPPKLIDNPHVDTLADKMSTYAEPDFARQKKDDKIWYLDTILDDVKGRDSLTSGELALLKEVIDRYKAGDAEAEELIGLLLP